VSDHPGTISTPYDRLPVEVRRENWGWFGPPWWSYVCYGERGRLIEEMRKAFPAGEKCLYCDEVFDEAAGDSGQGMPLQRKDAPPEIRHVHKECQFTQVTGSLAHHEGRCRCHGGSNGTPGMTVREEAVEVWRRLRAGILYPGQEEEEAPGGSGTD
jgi:hypothetical protein